MPNDQGNAPAQAQSGGAPAPGQQRLFRDSVLRKFSSPEHLDRLLTVTTPVGWLSLIGVGVLIALGLTWSIFSNLPVIVNGPGILLRSDKVWTVTSPANGIVEQLFVKGGDHVEAGQLVARLRQPRLVISEQQSRSQLHELEEARQHLADFEAKALADRRRGWDAREKALREEIDRVNEELAIYQRLVSDTSALTRQGATTQRQLLNAQAELAERQRLLADSRAQLVGLAAQRTEAEQEMDRRLFEMDQRVEDARRQAVARANDLKLDVDVIAAYSGTVLEVSTDVGRDAQQGDVLLRLEPPDEKIQAILYFPADQGKRAEPGMPARVAPEGFQKEEFGYIVGTVASVSAIPESEETLLLVLGSRSLAQEMTKAGPPIRIVVNLEQAPDSPSGFKWSSSRGPKQRITPGTLVRADVTIDRRRPIELAIPLLKSLLGV
ncbi:MAG TPA: NHLP bacteriocin system secretion protein [Methylomirabilota bacterium]|nr:NHLP bacteriocin system secretion protein [Methylomirabilota bacterium]